MYSKLPPPLDGQMQTAVSLLVYKASLVYMHTLVHGTWRCTWTYNLLPSALQHLDFDQITALLLQKKGFTCLTTSLLQTVKTSCFIASNLRKTKDHIALNHYFLMIAAHHCPLRLPRWTWKTQFLAHCSPKCGEIGSVDPGSQLKWQ